MRVLHLIDAKSHQTNGCTLKLLSESFGRLGDINQSLFLLGGEKLTHQARAVGLREATTLGVPLGEPVLGWSAIRRHAQRIGPIDLVHCWSLRSLALAVLMFRSIPRVLTVTVQPQTKQVHWLWIVTREAHQRTTILPISSTVRHAILCGGTPTDAVHVLRPGIDMGQIDHHQRRKLRKEWVAQHDKTKVIALLSDPTDASDALTAVMAMSMAQDSSAIGSFQLKMLMHPDQTNRLRAQTIQRHRNRPNTIIQDARIGRPWEVLPACDVALAIGPHSGGLSLLWAIAANIPVIGHATHAVSEIIEDHHSAILAQPGSPKNVAMRICQLLNDPQLSYKIRDTARHEAYSFFSRQRYCQSLRTVYQQIVAQENVEVPPMESTGGLRFAGRA